MANTIICPECGKPFEMTDALRHEIEGKVILEAEEKIRKQLQEQSSLEIDDLKKALDEKNQKLDELKEQELELRSQKRKLEEKEKDLDLQLERKLDEQKKLLSEEVAKQAHETHRLKDLEKEKTINDLKFQLEDALRKAAQGSQQLQGEVLELDLESLLRESFPNDEILPVGKGIRGADIKQVVRSPRGYGVGVVLWESKRTKAWSDGWLSKLKEDMRAEKANIAVIVSVVCPVEADSGMGIKDGVWVVKYPLVLALASLLRKNLLDLGYEKAVSNNRGKKADLLYEYVIGHEFRQQVEALAEVYKEMQEQVHKERIAFEKSWKARDGQIKRMVISTANMYGSMQGLVGSSMPEVKGLEMMELDSGEN